MVREWQKVAVIAVIIIVIAAGMAIVQAFIKPEPSEARAMIIDVNDVKASEGGDYWKQLTIGEGNPRNEHTAKSEAISWLSNETSDMSIEVMVDVFRMIASAMKYCFVGL